MDASLLNVLHDAGNNDLFVIAKRIDIDFISIFEELVDEYRALVGNLNCGTHVVVEHALVINDNHRPAAEHIGWTHKYRISDLARNGPSFFESDCGSILRLGNIEFTQQLPESFAVFCKIDRVWRCPDDRHTGILQIQREIQRSLPA